MNIFCALIEDIQWSITSKVLQTSLSINFENMIAILIDMT